MSIGPAIAPAVLDRSGHATAQRYPVRRAVKVGGVQIGGGAPCVIQSMTTTATTDVSESLEQIVRLAEAGCQIVRLSVPDEASAAGFAEIPNRAAAVADIHFKTVLALLAIDRRGQGPPQPRQRHGREHVEEVCKDAARRASPYASAQQRHRLPRYKTVYETDRSPDRRHAKYYSRATESAGRLVVR